MHLVTPLTGEQLRATIEGPAQVAGLKLEPGLVDLLLRDAADEPGALPLLSHALAETWQQREGTLLTVAAYRATGGISGAVAASAERLHASLSDEGRTQLRWLMLRLAGLADHGEPVRTPMERAIATDDAERAQVVDLLVRARLLTSADGSVELAHESLVRAWPRLRGWLEEDREGQRLWRHLAGASAEWERLGRPDSELYTGVRLAAARDWAAPRRRPADPAGAVVPGPVGGPRRGRAAHPPAAGPPRAAAEPTPPRLLVGAALALVAAMVAALLAVDQGRTAAVGTRRSPGVPRAGGPRGARQPLAQPPVHQPGRGRDPRGRGLAEARRRALGVGTGRHLHRRSRFPGLRVDPLRHRPGCAAARDAPRRRSPAATGCTSCDLDTGELGPLFHHPVADNDNQQVLRVSGDGRRVAQLLFDPAQMDACGHYERLVVDDGRGCTLLTVFDIETRRPVFGPVPTPFSGGDLAIDHSGSTVAVTGGFDGDLATYDVDRGTRLGTLSGLPRPDDAFNWRDTAPWPSTSQGTALPGLDERAGPRRRPGDAPGAAAVRGATAVDAQLPDRDPGRSPGRYRGRVHRRDQGDHRSGGVARRRSRDDPERLALPGGGGGRQARAALLRQPARRDRGAEPADGPADRRAVATVSWARSATSRSRTTTSWSRSRPGSSDGGWTGAVRCRG